MAVPLNVNISDGDTAMGRVAVRCCRKDFLGRGVVFDFLIYRGPWGIPREAAILAEIAFAAGGQ
jgi:hypothetical protein